MRTLLSVVTLCIAFASPALAREAGPGDQVQIEDIVLTVPDGWQLKQDAKDVQTVILGFRNGEQSFSLYAKPGTDIDMRAMFVNGSRVVEDITRLPMRGIDWDVMKTSKDASERGTHHVAAFRSVLNGNVYYGFAKSPARASADDALMEFLDSIRIAR